MFSGTRSGSSCSLGHGQDRLVLYDTFRNVLYTKAPLNLIFFQIIDQDATYEVLVTVEMLDGARAEAVEEIALSTVPLPPTPRNVRVTLRESTSLSLEWQISQSGLEVMSYMVKYAQMLDGQRQGEESQVTR